MARPGAAASLAEAFFLPGVCVVVVPVALPEAELIVIEELEAADPLRALPEVALRNEKAERVAVFWLEWLAAVCVSQHHVVVVEHIQRQVRRVALLAMGDDVRRGRADLGEAEDLLDRDALPVGVELRPPRDAMDVGVDGLARQRLELLPGQRERRVDLPPDAEIPRREVDHRYRAVVKDRELVGLVLTGRNPRRDLGILSWVAEESFEHRGCSVCLQAPSLHRNPGLPMSAL